MGLRSAILLARARNAESLAKDLDEGDPEGARLARKEAEKCRAAARKAA